MNSLWQHYVFRRGAEVPDMWDRMYSERRINNRPVRLLYIAGRGFDVRAQAVMSKFVHSLSESGCQISKAELLLVDITGYQLSEELKQQTEVNAEALSKAFASIGTTKALSQPVDDEDDDISATTALRQSTERVLAEVTDQTDIVLDVSSLPRIAYLSLMLGLLHKLIPDKTVENPLLAGDVNLQVVVAEDAKLDGQIRSEDPSNDLVLIPGYAGALRIESVKHWPLVWFPVLGENRIGQLQKVIDSDVIPALAEICPVLPHPSRNPRRGDQLLIEYRAPLFDAPLTPVTNILYVHESHPFEAYRQLLGAMKRYLESMRIMGGCHLVVTPLASKLITLGAGLACFEMKPAAADEDYGVAIPYAEPTRYIVSEQHLLESKPEVSVLVLTGESYGATRSVGVVAAVGPKCPVIA